MKWRAVLAGLAVLGLSGCGSKPLSSTQLVTQGTRVCTRAGQLTDVIAAPHTPAGTAAFLRRGIAVLTPELVALKALRPSTDVADVYSTAIDSFSLATDIAEELVRRGVAFRSAHERVAVWSRLAARANADLRDVVAAESRELRSFVKSLTPESAVRRRDLPGGTAPRRVRGAIARTRRKLVGPPPSPPGRGAG